MKRVLERVPPRFSSGRLIVKSNTTRRKYFLFISTACVERKEIEKKSKEKSKKTQWHPSLDLYCSMYCCSS